MSSFETYSSFFDMAIERPNESGYSSEDVSSHSSPCPPVGVTQALPVLYYVVVPPGYHLEFFPVQPECMQHPEVLASDTAGLMEQQSDGFVAASETTTWQRRLIKWSLPPPSVLSAQLPGWTPMPYGLERYWQTAFAWFFRPYWTLHQSLWTFQPVELPPVCTKFPWHSYCFTAKVHFQCPAKHPGWTSKKGIVTFWFRVRPLGSRTVCEVLFKQYGQQCSKCSQLSNESAFLPALWYPENIEEAVRGLAIQVDEAYYGGFRVKELRSCGQQCIRQPSVKSSAFHDTSRCQACLEGLCVLRV